MKTIPLSKIGRLREKLDKSGISGPIISNRELDDLLNGMIEFERQAVDWEDRPLSSLLRLDIERIRAVIACRKE